MPANLKEKSPGAYGDGKRRLNLSVRGDLIDRARRAGLNLSQLFEESLAQRLRQDEGRRWQEDNREAIKHHRQRIEREGMWNDGLTSF